MWIFYKEDAMSNVEPKLMITPSSELTCLFLTLLIAPDSGFSIFGGTVMSIIRNHANKIIADMVVKVFVSGIRRQSG